MPGFSRSFPFIDRLFPHQQSSGVQPSEVSDSVQLISDIDKADIRSKVLLGTVDSSAAGAAANITLTLLPEPASREANILVGGFIFTTGNAAPVRAQIGVIEITPGKNPDLPVGLGWSFGIVGALFVLTIDVTADHFIMLPFSGFTIPRNNRVDVLFEAVPVGTTVRTRAFFTALPIELVDWSQVKMVGGGFTRTGVM